MSFLKKLSALADAQIIPFPGKKIGKKETQKSLKKTSTKPKDPFDDDDAVEFLERWRDSEGFSDFNLALDRGFAELAAWILKEAGVFEDEEEETNGKILYWLKGYNDSKAKHDTHEMLKNTEIWVSRHNETAFIPQGDVDYFVDQEGMKDSGYEFEYGYDEHGNEYKESRLS